MRPPMAGLIVLATMLMPVIGSGAQLPEGSASANRVAVRARQLLEVKQGTMLVNPVLLIEGQRITAAGSNLPIPGGTQVIDLGDVTLLPGLIDCHTHLLSRMAPDGNYGLALLTKSQAYRALEGAANARRTVFAGFTTVRDVENEGAGYADVSLRDAIDRGLIEGPRMQVATRGIAAVGKYHPFGVSPDLSDFPRGAQMVSGVEEARRAAREQIGNGADLIKVYADWVHPTLTVDELRVVVEEAHKAGRRVAAHATSNQGIRNALEAGADSIEHGDGADRATLQMMKDKGVWLVPTQGPYLDAVAKAKGENALKAAEGRVLAKRKMLTTAREVGVKIANGYDPFEAATHGTNAREVIALQAAGFTNLEAIRSATSDAAELLGWQERIGSLEPGKFADIIAIPGNPLQDINLLEQVLFVMKGGAVIRRQQ